MLERILVALSGKVRKATLDGKSYLVAPCVMGTEAVLAGNAGPGFYAAQEWAKATPAWNMKPITVGHPQRNGEYVSAADPEILEKQQIGFLLNTKWDSKLKTECWFDEEKTKLVDNRVHDALVSNKITEVSTGVFVTKVDSPGEFNGTKYDWLATNHQPDHLAILPDQIGACSVEMGAGLLVNSAPSPFKSEMVVNGMSLGAILSGVRQALYQKYEKPGYDWYGYVEDVYDGYAVYYSGGKLYKIGYTVADGVVALAGEPQEVVRVIQYQTTDGKVVGNASVYKVITNQEHEMSVKFDKTAHVNSLIGNGYAETDREWLMKLDDSVAEKIKPAPAPVANKEEKKVEPPAEPVVNAQVVKAPTLAELVANADPATREQFSEMQASYAAEKASLVSVIVGNAANKFPKEVLEAKPLADLRAIAALAAPSAPAPQPQNFGFYGAVPAAPVVNSAVPDDFLPQPTVNAMFPAADAK